MIRYKIYQNQQKKGLNAGKWFARAVSDETFDLAKLAEHMSKNEEMDLFVSRTSATPVRLRLRIKATLIHTIGGESHCGCPGRALNKASLYGV